MIRQLKIRKGQSPIKSKLYYLAVGDKFSVTPIPSCTLVPSCGASCCVSSSRELRHNSSGRGIHADLHKNEILTTIQTLKN